MITNISSSVETKIENYPIHLLQSGYQNCKTLECTVNTQYFLENGLPITAVLQHLGTHSFMQMTRRRAVGSRHVGSADFPQVKGQTSDLYHNKSFAKYSLYFRADSDFIANGLTISYYMCVVFSI